MNIGAIVGSGRYRVVRVLGRGGMGVVVEATHLQLDTRVALKFLDEGMAREPKAAARFLREARACAQLKSENICRVSDFGMDGTQPFIVMELLVGSDLAKLVRSRPLDVATAVQYVVQVCTGLAEAHAARIVHRDLKPGNLFVTRRADGSAVVKILDFGVAKTESDGPGPGLTATAHVVGSPGFMAPEQVRSSKTVDARADIWSLGVILYQLISGRLPFKADSFAEFALAIVRDAMPPLPEAPPALGAIVACCLEKQPERRYQDVAALAFALAPFTTGVAAMATIAEPAVRPTPVPRPKAAVATLVGGSGMYDTLINEPADPSSVPVHVRQTLMSSAISTPADPLAEYLAPGTIVGEYRIERKIGEGGMGVVYSAIHPLIGKKAAIKVISTGLGTDPSTIARFVQEARSVNQIGHPNIVDVFAFGNLPDGRNYFVMEHLQGESLRERLARTAMSLGDSLEILDEIAGALEAAHEKQIVHRDLKPDNIYLASVRGGRIIVKLLDFGIAKLAVADGPAIDGIAKTRTGMMMGTPAYLSPEQARGTNVGFKTDIYALGCMIFEMVCRQLPFVATSAMDVVLMHIQTPPPRPSDVWPGIPAKLEELVLQMLEKDPERRPSLPVIRGVFTELVTTGVVTIEQGSGTFRSELRSRRHSEAPSYRTPPPDVTPTPTPIVVEPPPAPPIAAPPRSRAGLVIGVALAVALATGATVFLAMRGGDPEPIAPIAPAAPAPKIVPPSPPVVDAAVAVVAADATIAPDATIAKAVGFIAIQVNDAKARIEVDGTEIGTVAGVAKIPQATGSHHVVITAPGRVPYDTTVNVDGDATVTLDVKLDKPHHGTTAPARPRPASGSGSARPPTGPNDSTINPFAN